MPLPYIWTPSNTFARSQIWVWEGLCINKRSIFILYVPQKRDAFVRCSHWFIIALLHHSKDHVVFFFCEARWSDWQLKCFWKCALWHELEKWSWTLNDLQNMAIFTTSHKVLFLWNFFYFRFLTSSCCSCCRKFGYWSHLTFVFKSYVCFSCL